MTVRTRYAPSPTGFMHVGNLRTALYEYLVAKSQGGKFILRIEDTDRERLVEGAVDFIYNTLKLAGLQHDEGPDIGGGFGPYVQSERKDMYLPYAEQLIAEGKAYRCFCSKERLEKIQNETVGGGYDRHCRDLPQEEIDRLLAEGVPYVIRQKMPTEGSTTFTDAVFGDITVENSELQDQILIKTDGYPTYNFANVIDDHTMGITHVVRGSEYLSSTPKYNLLYEAFGWEIPTYIHLPLIMGKDADGNVSKLSKRHGATGFYDLIDDGYLPQAIINYIALLGWCPKDNQEIFTLSELEKAFDISGISKSPSVFDYDKLSWFNGEYLKAMTAEEFTAVAMPYYKQVFGEKEMPFEKFAAILQKRTTQLTQIPGMLDFFAELPEYGKELFVNKKSKTNLENAPVVLKEAYERLKALPDWTADAVHDCLIDMAAEKGLKNGTVMWPVRIAAAGKTVTPGGAIEILDILGREESLKRLEIGLDKLNTTRFPPEPNGYLHIGHAKAVCINFATAEKFGGICNLRMDDTNPTKEDVEYVDAIKEDIAWLGFHWDDRFFYASEYFEQMYDFAVELIQKGLAYVCELTPEQMREYRGDTQTPAKSPYRDRPIEESLDLFARMRAGEFPDGSMTLRAKIDLASGNFNMRDPVIYRINRMHHHRTGDQWCIYPMYDFAHPIEDALEGITHSLCSLEFEAHRPLYDWVIENISAPCKPRQIEFARLGINNTVMSKRRLRALVEENYVSGWDDPRMPTLCGLRRRGYTPKSIRSFIDQIGVSKVNSIVEYSFLEHCLRDDLNETAERTMCVLRPVKLIITNYPEGQSESFSVENNPNRPEDGTREVTFSRECWIEQDDFMEVPIKKYQRLYPGNEVRLKSAYIVKCTGCEKDADGNVTAVYATYDPETRGGNTPDGRKVRGTIHWVDAANCADAEVRLYDNLFTVPDPDVGDRNFLDFLNPHSLEVLTGCKAEKNLETAVAPKSFQFMRLGYFCVDNKDSSPEHLVFNRSVSLKDGFKKK